MPTKLIPREKILTLLAENPQRIAAATRGLKPAQLQSPLPDSEWSVNDVLAHLRACADVFGNAMTTIIVENKPTFRAINPRTWIHQTNYPELKFQPSLRAFLAQRAELLALLEPLPPKAWSRTATVTGAGKVLVRNVLFYGDWLAVHERSHVKHLERMLKRAESR